MSNIETVRDVYAAFGRGDVAAILERVADDIEWEYGMADNGVPWFQAGRGRDRVLRFFESLGAVEFQQFSPKTLLERDDVVALIDVAFTVKASGVAVAEEDEVHIWHFDPQGKVARFCHKADTHQHRAAFQGTVAVTTNHS